MYILVVSIKYEVPSDAPTVRRVVAKRKRDLDAWLDQWPEGKIVAWRLSDGDSWIDSSHDEAWQHLTHWNGPAEVL